MTIKKLGKMGAILGLCLSITIVSFINGIENHLIKAKAETIDDTKSDIDFINQVNDITMPLNAKTLLSDEELQDLIKIGKISNVSCDYNFTGNKTNLYNIINLNSKIYIQDEGNYSLLYQINSYISDIADDEIRKYIENTILDIINRVLLDKRRKDDVHKLLSLKILMGDFEDQEQLGEYFEKDNLIVISLNNILKNANNLDDLYMNLFDTIMISSSCPICSINFSIYIPFTLLLYIIITQLLRKVQI